MRRRYDGRFFGRRVNCEHVPALPAWAVRCVLEDPRKIPYLLIWKSRVDGGIKEAVRLSDLGPTQYLPNAQSIEVKRTDQSVVHLRVLNRPLPRHRGHDISLACPHCCALRRFLYAWEAGGEYTHSAIVSMWQCRSCAGLRYSSEGEALLLRSRGNLGRMFGTIHSNRPDPWYPEIYPSPVFGKRNEIPRKIK